MGLPCSDAMALTPSARPLAPRTTDAVPTHVPSVAVVWSGASAPSDPSAPWPAATGGISGTATTLPVGTLAPPPSGVAASCALIRCRPCERRRAGRCEAGGSSTKCPGCGPAHSVCPLPTDISRPEQGVGAYRAVLHAAAKLHLDRLLMLLRLGAGTRCTAAAPRLEEQRAQRERDGPLVEGGEREGEGGRPAAVVRVREQQGVDRAVCGAEQQLAPAALPRRAQQQRAAWAKAPR